MVVATEMLFGVLQQERRLSHTSCALNANEPVGPVNLVHKDASYRGIGVVHQVGMLYWLYSAKIMINFNFANHR